MSKTTTQCETDGEIIPGRLYTLSAACSRLKWGRAAYRSAVSQGLRVLRKCGRAYLSGTELIRFIESDQRPAGS
jgi:hypothetical protein